MASTTPSGVTCTDEDILNDPRFQTIIMLLIILIIFSLTLCIYVLLLKWRYTKMLKDRSNQKSKPIKSKIRAVGGGGRGGPEKMPTFRHHVEIAKLHDRAEKNFAEYENTLKQKRKSQNDSKKTAKSRLARRIQERNEVIVYIDNAKFKISQLGKEKVVELTSVLGLKNEPEFLDGHKLLSLFQKLQIQEPERVLMALSRGNGGHVFVKYFLSWTFSDMKVRVHEDDTETKREKNDENLDENRENSNTAL
jgi:hypothetical protein